MGQEGIVLAFGEAVTDTGNTTQQYPLGTIRMEETSDAVGIETYRYVYFTNGAGNVAAAAGALCYRGVTQADPWDVTSDVSDVDSAFAVGVFQSVLVDATYGWVKTKGSKEGKLRMEWWKNKAISLGLPTTGKWISDVVKHIHPFGEKPCQICGKVLSIRYEYPTKKIGRAHV